MCLKVERLWLGDMAGAYNKFLLKKNRVSHIVTVAEGIQPKFPAMFNYKQIHILDAASANLKQHLKSCIKYIKEALDSGGTVLVHCYSWCHEVLPSSQHFLCKNIRLALSMLTSMSSNKDTLSDLMTDLKGDYSSLDRARQ